MLFTSYGFIGFVALLLVLYYIVPQKMRWPLLLFFSYVFYYLADPIYLVYITVTSVSIWYLGVSIEKLRARQADYLALHKEALSREEKKSYKASVKKKQWRILLAALVLNLGILAVLKYTNFAISNINGILDSLGKEPLGFWQIALPMGISFYTFQAVGYIIDVYRGTVTAEQNPFRFMLFVSFFPQLVQGPISRYGDLSKTLYAGAPFERKNLAFGLQRILWGFFKKLVIADRILVGVNAIIGDTDTYSGIYVFVGMLFYALELYADFTGGIDITIGVAECLGITVTENFRRPYFSKNIKEYWNRWHITMGSWFTDYIFYPITVCGPMLKLSKVSRRLLGEKIGKRVPIYLSGFVVWLATGIWHGASWNFVAWGLANYVVIMISQEFDPLYARFHNAFPCVKGTRAHDFVQVIRTILLMSLLRTFDCYRDVPLTIRMVGTMFTEPQFGRLFDGSFMRLGLSLSDYVVLLIGLVILIAVSLIQRRESVRVQIARLPYWHRFCIWYGLFLIVLIFGAYGVGYDASQFIYNQF